jgi:hypothetical protein
MNLWVSQKTGNFLTNVGSPSASRGLLNRDNYVLRMTDSVVSNEARRQNDLFYKRCHHYTAFRSSANGNNGTKRIKEQKTREGTREIIPRPISEGLLQCAAYPNCSVLLFRKQSLIV